MGIFSRKTKQEDQTQFQVDEAQEMVSKAAPPSVKEVSDSDQLSSVLGVLVQPRVSEKAGRLSTQGKYVFLVKKAANKVEVKKAVERVYKVNVVGINIVNVKGKHKVFGRTSGRTSDFKKAIVTLKKGQTIEGIVETA